MLGKTDWVEPGSCDDCYEAFGHPVIKERKLEIAIDLPPNPFSD